MFQWGCSANRCDTIYLLDLHTDHTFYGDIVVIQLACLTACKLNSVNTAGTGMDLLWFIDKNRIIRNFSIWEVTSVKYVNNGPVTVYISFYILSFKNAFFNIETYIRTFLKSILYWRHNPFMFKIYSCLIFHVLTNKLCLGSMCFNQMIET